MGAIVSIVVFRASVSEVSYAVKITGVPKPVVVGFLACLALPAAVTATWLLWRRLDYSIKHSTDTLARIARGIVVVTSLTLAQLPTLITLTQGHEAARYVISSIYRAVVNAVVIPDFQTDTAKPASPVRKR